MCVCVRERERVYLSVQEVVSPQRSYLVLTPYIPHGEANVLILYSLHIKTFTHRMRERERKRERSVVYG